MAQPTLWTIGHGSRPIEQFVGMLREAGIACLVDVRAYPASRRHPQFERAALEQALAAAGISYVWGGKGLGGRRRPTGQSPHIALEVPAFRAYADHMMTEGFRGAIDRLMDIAGAHRTAIMCAERLPWQCHRFLVADYLEAHGTRIVHLIGEGAAREHHLNPVARLRDGVLVYDGHEQRDLGL